MVCPMKLMCWITNIFGSNNIWKIEHDLVSLTEYVLKENQSAKWQTGVDFFLV